MKKKPYVLGVTGHRASGKTTVCNFFADLGAFVIDADDIVHELYKSGEIGARLIERNFGKDFLNSNGDVDRAELFEAIVQDPQKLVLLNSLIHPLVKDRLMELIADLDEKLVVIEAAYFEEGLLLDLVDYLVYIDASDEFVDWIEPFSSYLENFYRQNEESFSEVLVNDSSLDNLKESVVEIFHRLPYK